MVGSHAMSHRPLAADTPENALAELVDSRAFLEEVSGRTIEAVSYPLGNPGAVNRRVGELALRAGYRIGWTMERANNRTLADPLLLARIDASDIASMAALPTRSRYHDERQL